MMKFLAAFAVLLAFSHPCFAQGEIDDEKKIFYRNERSYAFSLNSNGWGANFRYGKRIDAFRKTLYTIDLSEFRHPKQESISNPAVINSNNFVFGKLNYVYNFRFGFGKQRQLYRKMDKGGVTIRYFYNYGASVALLKPIYYEILSEVNGNVYITDEKFNIDKHHIALIWGRASFFKGVKEIGFRPGVYAKAGVSFEYSKRDRVIHALEAGVVVDGYLIDVPIMATEESQRVFVNLFVSYRFGKVIKGGYTADIEDFPTNP